MSTITEVSRAKSVISGRSGGGVDYVGFANFPNQVFRRCIKNGFEFTLMVVGQSGLGKSTFLNTLFMAELHDLKNVKSAESKPTVKIESKTFRLAENDVRLKLTVVDTPGFGDFVDNSKCWEPIVKYIDDRFADYLMEETKIERSPKIEDKRIHLCLYFIAPTGHGLKQLDIAFLQALHARVNIIPIIAKADTLTPNELGRFKQNIMEDLKKNAIFLYKFPELITAQAHQKQQQQRIVENVANNNNNQNNGEETIIGGGGGAVPNGKGPAPPPPLPPQMHHQNQLELSERLPFAVVGSTHVKEILVGSEGRATKQRVRVREYPWGIVEVDNLKHNDFIAVRETIIRNNLIDLIETTRCFHYENYRMRNLPQSSFDDDPFTQLEKETGERLAEAEDTRQKQELLFNEGVADREQRLMKRAQAMDSEEKENRRVLEEKRELLEKLKRDISETKRGGNLSASSLDSGSFGTGSVPRNNQNNNNHQNNNNNSNNTSPPDKLTTKKKIVHLFGARNC